jgi:hypothetical protein
MGRTIPSFRLASGEEEREWKVFRNALDKSDRKIFDEMFSISHLYNSVCFYAANLKRIHQDDCPLKRSATSIAS